MCKNCGMKICGKDCKYFVEAKNTDETGRGICSYPNDSIIAMIGDICAIQPRPYTCAACARFLEDDACIDADADDLVFHDGTMCPNFIDQRAEDVFEAIFEWKLRGLDVEGILSDIKEDVDSQYKELD